MGASERDEEARARRHERVRLLDPGRFAFVDERGTNVGLAPPRASGPSGRRRPRNRGKNTTLLASMGPGRMGPCLTLEGGTTAVVFEAYVERVLAPSLSPGQVVVLDDLSTHKGDKVRELVEERGAELLCSCPPTRRTSRPLRRR